MFNSPLLIVVAIVVLAVFLGSYLAKRLRMKDVGWKLTFILTVFGLAIAVLRYGDANLGIDLRGGDILIYEVDAEKTAESLAADEQAAAPGDPRAPGRAVVDMSMLIQSLQRRINPGGVREVVIREYGTNQVEIIIPEVSESEIETIKDAIRKTGFLKFRIVADKTRHPYIWGLGEKQLASESEAERMDALLRDGEQIVGEWVKLGREDITTPGEIPPYRMQLDFVKGEMLWREVLPEQIEVLTVVDDENNVEGNDLSGVNRGVDEYGAPSVDFAMTSEGAVRMGRLTGSNLPDSQTGNEAKLGIILDNELLSSPGIRSQISTNGTIEGRFTEKEVNTLIRILRDGKMPAVLFPNPISENNISPLLGIDTIRKGTMATCASLAVVMVFMLCYYRFAGIVACLALIANLALTIGTMMLISASFTLPGIAGLVLTVGMSVDANVLIFERIREELLRGASLRMALRNGFDRATTTIVDANVTTMIVAFVLYLIGTADLRGFAITLILGILMSMFTAIFCSRVFFEIAERQRWIRDLHMVRWLGETKIAFIRRAHLAMVGSLVLIAMGFFAVYSRGPGLFDIDFRGGTSVQVVLKDPMPIEQMRTRLASIAADVWITQVNPRDRAENTVFKVDTTLQDEQELQQRVQQQLESDTGDSLLESRSLNYTPVTAANADKVSRHTTHPRPPAVQPQHRFVAGRDPQFLWAQAAAPGDTAEDTQDEQPDDRASETVTEAEVTEADLPLDPNVEATAQEVVADDGEDAGQTAESLAFRSASKLTFQEKISARTLRRLMEESAQKMGKSPPRVKITNDDWDGRSEAGFSEWNVSFTSDLADTEHLLQTMQSEMAQLPIWLSSNKIGGKIAGHMRGKAIRAILFSLVAIVGYIWLRFQSVAHGLAAVAALIHDVAITLGFIALSLWLSRAAGFLLIDEFKISLPIVAAFLTLIGYSLNDTIVIFDRIREVKGKSPNLTEQMVDLSINQTLSRTLLTSFTTLIVVGILYTFGGGGIHGFAFALLIGVLAGTYSTVFIASPSLLWMWQWWKSRQSSRQNAATVSVR